MGWLYGFKQHLVVNDNGEIINFLITKGNVDDRDPLLDSKLLSQVKGKLFGDRGSGAMVTVDFAGESNDEKKARRDVFIKTVSDEIKIIPSLGDPHTIIMPVESVWGAKYPEPGILRISAGFEDTSSLEATIAKALKAVAGI